MNHSIIIALLFILVENGFSQVNNFTVKYQVKFNRNYDSEIKAIQLYEGTLISNNTSSLFYVTPNNKTKNIDNDETNFYFDVVDTLFKVEKIFNDDVLIFFDRTFSTKRLPYKDSLHTMHWNLLDTTKMIDTFKCLKAETFFRGRKYICWYTTNIAVPNGPWKLGGLPGLILEAYDSKNDLYFLVDSITYNSKEPLFLITNNTNLTKIPSYTQYLEKGKNFIKKLKSNLKAQQSNCLECNTETEINFKTWEKVF